MTAGDGSGKGAHRPQAADEPRTGRARLVLAILPLVVLALLAAIFYTQLVSGRDASAVPSALIGEPAPALDLPPLDGLLDGGKPVPAPSQAMIGSRPALVNVWASWCVPCRQEHPLLTALGKDERIVIIGINYKDKRENALRFLGELGNPFDAVGIDPGGRTAIDWGVYGVPETFLVDADGIIRYKHIGPLTPETMRTKLMPEIEAAIAASD